MSADQAQTGLSCGRFHTASGVREHASEQGGAVRATNASEEAA
jgi:hypothetical protein